LNPAVSATRFVCSKPFNKPGGIPFFRQPADIIKITRMKQKGPADLVFCNVVDISFDLKW